MATLMPPKTIAPTAADSDEATQEWLRKLFAKKSDSDDEDDAPDRPAPVSGGY